MEPIFEVKYLAIKWENSTTIENIKESLFPVKIDIIDQNNYSLELQTYTRIENKLDGQVGFHIYDESSEIEPNFIDASGNYIPLLKIKDPNTQKYWWIENGKWREKYREAPLWNHAGTAKIQFGFIKCNIDIRAISFSMEELNIYLSDFKNDFWKLIYKENSLTSGDVKQKEIKVLNDKTLYLISQFIAYTTKILANPKKELKEIQTLKDSKNVRPVVKTYMEIASKGISKKLTSRDYSESYDVPENRYIYYIINKVYVMGLQILNALDYEQKFMKDNQASQKKRLEAFSSTKKINKRVFEHELKQLEERVSKEISNLAEALEKQDEAKLSGIKQEIVNNEQFLDQIKEALIHEARRDIQPDCHEFIIKLENRQEDLDNTIQFWGKIKSPESNEWDDFGQNNKLSLKFNKNTFGFLRSNQEYVISASNIYTTKNMRIGTIHNIFFSHISKLEPLAMANSVIIEHKTMIIELGKKNPLFGEIVQFNGKEKINQEDDWIQLPQNDFYSFNFNKNIFSNALGSNNTYQIKGYVSKNIKPWSKGDRDSPTYKEGNIHEFFFKYIEDIQLLDSSLEKKMIKEKEEFIKLEKLGWKMPMTQNELRQQEYEKETINKSLDDLTQQNIEINKHKEELEKKLIQIKKLLNEFQSLKIKEDSSFPNSMTFIQNPNYQGSKKMFTSFLDAIGIEEDMFKSLLLVDQIGIVDVPVLYERWCLLQIIKVLIDEYHFIPEPDWKKLLISQILTIKHNVKINFSSDVIGREIVLWYEKELESKKRPDYILEIKSQTTGTTRKFIMDAKFREDVNIKDLMQEMYYSKNYSENNKNMVFILHPDTGNNIDNFSNPQSWAEKSYYGETQLMNYIWDKGYPDHRYGSILLSPFTNNENSGGGYLDNLKRLIAMFLQYGMEDNSNINQGGMANSMIKEKSFCTLCGSDNLDIKQFTPRSRMGYGYTVICQDCKHHMEYNYCSGCKNRLIKNGRYWSYHATKPIEQFNIKCPHCGDFLLEEST